MHYNFSDRPTMEQMVINCEFIETAEFSGNMYGTSRAAVEAVAESGKVCILDIDVQGVRAVKESRLEGVRYVFVRPPSLEVLEERLRARGTETEEAIEKVCYVMVAGTKNKSFHITAPNAGRKMWLNMAEPCPGCPIKYVYIINIIILYVIF